MTTPSIITALTVRDIRFPTSLEAHGSDAINDPDYSCAYVILETDTGLRGCGLTFTIGRGNEIVCKAIDAYKRMVVGTHLSTIYGGFGTFWHKLTQDPQMRWLGPEKGVTHLAVAAIINALWDLWGKIENKPVWKLLASMGPEEIVPLIDFQYISDVLTPEEAVEILKKSRAGILEREKSFLNSGYPAYTTSAGWLGYSEDKIKRLCRQAKDEGFTRFKVKVGLSKEDDERRLALVRHEIGDQCTLMVDANQRWDVQEAIKWMKPLTKYNLLWIEEPTSPDDVLGHATIAKALAPYGVGVATGESCQNRVLFKQLLQAQGLNFCQIDSCRLGGVNEILAVYLMAHKFDVPVCPHAGGVGLCEMVIHLQAFDYLGISTTQHNRVIEYVDHLHEHFVNPVQVAGGRYMAPTAAGYSTEMKESSLRKYEYPSGSEWQRLFSEGKFTLN
ncbi:hypothetical protein CAPTEDRAFT_181186 [Capitella teleta]|uniref:Mitochondrial enolase superfamily member 1 n=1 Tax=Capitella teleta TaxID=283909 RepID=R7UGF7_CAPTE|nr:hypothetical protein CAPTEDRAFT_181186 [Capitella teleta]|eukprot:ELU05310.1 hypothetical protein CAPTEDRAFT_181186 [Capitella teleta]